MQDVHWEVACKEKDESSSKVTSARSLKFRVSENMKRDSPISSHVTMSKFDSGDELLRVYDWQFVFLGLKGMVMIAPHSVFLIINLTLPGRWLRPLFKQLKIKQELFNPRTVSEC